MSRLVLLLLSVVAVCHANVSQFNINFDEFVCVQQQCGNNQVISAQFPGVVFVPPSPSNFASIQNVGGTENRVLFPSSTTGVPLAAGGTIIIFLFQNSVINQLRLYNSQSGGTLTFLDVTSMPIGTTPLPTGAAGASVEVPVNSPPNTHSVIITFATPPAGQQPAALAGFGWSAGCGDMSPCDFKNYPCEPSNTDLFNIPYPDPSVQRPFTVTKISHQSCNCLRFDSPNKWPANDYNYQATYQ